MREDHLRAACIKTNKLPVPRYFNHHVEVEANVVAPQTSMAFYPHKGDLDSPRKQKKWKGFIKELDKSEIRSGLDAIKIDQKRSFVIHYDRVVEVSRYLDTWLEALGIPGLDKWALVKHVVDQNRGKVLSANSRSKILAWRSIAESSSPAAERGAAMFVEAWKIVFGEEKTNHGVVLPEIDLLEVFQLDEDILACAGSQDAAAAAAAAADDNDVGSNTFEDLEAKMSTYSSLGCLICFKHSCEHGFYTDDNQRERFSLDKGTVVRRLAEKQRQAIESRRRSSTAAAAANDQQLTQAPTPCARRCYLEDHARNYGPAFRQWTNRERQVIRALFLSFETSRVDVNAVCHAATLLGRDCCDVYREHRSLGIKLPAVTPPPRGAAPDEVEVPSLGWYNRWTKKLSKRHGADKYHRPNWDHIRRDIDSVCAVRGCDHDGPCSPSNPACPCAAKGQFCEKFCGCSVAGCAYKFTGCACRSKRRTCRFDEECICIQLNRECDPDLCGTCGAVERADPSRAGDDALHATGCQNCPLQRGAARQLVMGRSQSHGYGLFAAEPLPKDAFVIEYVGELVSGDEGDRRYIRRQNLFDGTKALSFNFTLLKECDVWIDGARYGNLSRYINHERSGGHRCNILPRIVLVNGAFRIELRAKRNIAAWEELSFDYGEDFGLDIEDKPRRGRVGRPPGRKAARKNAQGSSPRRRVTGSHDDQDSSSESSEGEEEDESESDDEEERDKSPESEEEVIHPSRKRKRPRDSDDEDEEDGGVRSSSPTNGRAAYAEPIRTRNSSRAARGPTRAPTTRSRGGVSTRGGTRATRQASVASSMGSSRPSTSTPVPAATNAHTAATNTHTTATFAPVTSAPAPAPAPAGAAAGGAGGATSGRTRASARIRRVSARVAEIEDSEDEGSDVGMADREEEQEEEEEGKKTPVTTPQKRDQPSRNRRQPAKLKDCDVWSPTS